jgi:hypothetical protein
MACPNRIKESKLGWNVSIPLMRTTQTSSPRRCKKTEICTDPKVLKDWNRCFF